MGLISKIENRVQRCATSAELKQAIQNAGDKLIVIHFYDILVRNIEDMDLEIAAMANGAFFNVRFLKVNVDEKQNEQAVQDYNITDVSTFILVKNNQKVKSA